MAHPSKPAKLARTLSAATFVPLAFFVSCLMQTSDHCLAGPHKVLIPKIDFEEKEFNFGSINEGIEVRHVFKVRNLGEKTLSIRDIRSTCGCTVAQMKHKKIAPGATADLEVIMDTSMKQGDVNKTIDIASNDPLNKTVSINVKAKVTSPHADLGTGSERTAKIFTGRCAKCHVENGIGKQGEDLFFADCAMCHGYRAKGIPGEAPALIPFDYHNKIIAGAMRTIIAKGSKTHRSMPGFDKESGGPLDEKQIDSLIEYLRWRSDNETKSEKKQESQEKQQTTTKSPEPAAASKAH